MVSFQEKELRVLWFAEYQSLILTLSHFWWRCYIRGMINFRPKWKFSAGGWPIRLLLLLLRKDSNRRIYLSSQIARRSWLSLTWSSTSTDYLPKRWCFIHWSLQVRKTLNATFLGKWIRRNGLISWSPRSPDKLFLIGVF